MIIFLFIGFVLLFVFSVCFRLVVTHPVKTVKYSLLDTYRYFRYKHYNELETGKLICYTALFGGGKTLSCVHYITGLYHKYDGLKVWDSERKKFVTQKVHVISNVDLNIPYEHFESLAQIVRVSEKFHDIDAENDTLTRTLVLGDEFSVQLNSRSFKTNIDPLFLNTLLTCRHHHISLVYNAQRFNHVDALLRQVTSYVVECHKVWRFMIQSRYDAFVLENAVDPTIIKPVSRGGWFICDKDYTAYDTLACVGNLKKAVEAGDMETEIEIINRQANHTSDVDRITNPTRKFSRMHRRHKR